MTEGGAGEMLVACCQVEPRVGDPVGNASLTREAVADAVAAGAKIIVLPELANSGYVFESVEEARANAIHSDDPLFQAWALEAAKGDAIVVSGFCEAGEDGRLHNSSVLLDGDGVRAVYRKIHLWDEEFRWFEPGAAPAPVLDTACGRIGLGVCFDIEFPELARGLALDGAELIALPANWPRDPVTPDERPVLHALASVTAYANKVFVATSDRCGTERGVPFEGASAIVSPEGIIRASAAGDRGAQTIYASCDLSLSRQKRVGPRNDAFADRRPGLYSAKLHEAG